MIKKYKHAWVLLLYMPIYLIWFFVLEKRTGMSVILIHSNLDQFIPFNEWFIIPYLVWFPYLIGGVLFFYFRALKSKEEMKQYWQMAFFLVSGMTICLVIYTIWPNGLHLRPAAYPRENIATDIVAALQGFDTPTNVCPSLHVYTSLVINAVLWRSRYFMVNKTAKIISLVVMLLICISTVFLKQHSILDVFFAFLLFILLYFVTYFLFSKTRKNLAEK